MASACGTAARASQTQVLAHVSPNRHLQRGPPMATGAAGESSDASDERQADETLSPGICAVPPGISSFFRQFCLQVRAVERRSGRGNDSRETAARTGHVRYRASDSCPSNLKRQPGSLAHSDALRPKDRASPLETSFPRCAARIRTPRSRYAWCTMHHELLTAAVAAAGAYGN